jgi:hypothetical protein
MAAVLVQLERQKKIQRSGEKASFYFVQLLCKLDVLAGNARFAYRPA